MNDKNKSYLSLIPVLIAICIVPLVMRLYLYDSGLNDFPWFAVSGNQSSDLFLYYKSRVLIFLLVIICIVLLIKGIKNQNFIREIPVSFYPLLIYMLLAIVSTVFSENRSFSLHGISEQFEPLGVLLAYAVLTIYTYVIVNTPEKTRIILIGWIILISILGIIGLSQIMGHDLVNTTISKILMIPSSHAELRDSLSFVFGKNRVYLTLYNPNYVGMLAALAIPMFAVFLVFSKSTKAKIIFSILTLLMLVSVVGSQSKNAFISIGVCLIAGVIIFRKKLIKIWKTVLLAIAVLIVIGIGIDAMNHFSYSKSFLAIFQHGEANQYKLEDIQTNDDNVVITYNDKKIKLSYTIDGNQFQLLASDENGDTLINYYDAEAGQFIFEDEALKDMQLLLNTVNGKLSIILKEGEKLWPISNDFDDGGYRICNSLGKWDKVVSAKSVGIFPEASFSGRGYLWNRTIPLLKSYLVVGSGPDTFTLVYPQQDYVSKYNNGYDGTFATKPHNMYLQMAVQTGVLSVIAFLVFYLIYFIESIKLYFKNDFDMPEAVLGVSIFIGTFGYMISGITNDSCVAVAPIFWVMLGLGLAINRRNKQQELQDSLS